MTEYTVLFRAHPRPDGVYSFRTVYAETPDAAKVGIYKLRNTENIVEIVDCFPTIRNQ